MESLNPYAPDYLPNYLRPTFYSTTVYHPHQDVSTLPYPPDHHQLQPFFSDCGHHFPFPSPVCVPSPGVYYCCLPSPAFYSGAACWPREEVEVVYLMADMIPPTKSPYHSQRATLTLLGGGDDDKVLKTNHDKEDAAAAVGRGMNAHGVAVNDKLEIPKVKSGPRRPDQRKYIAKRLQVDNFQFDPTILEDRRTTVMIKNIPIKFTKKTLLDKLDRHCFLKNDDIRKGKDSAIQSEYDFLYLPIDFKRESNKGYAFVNFTSPVAARRLYDSFHNFKWNTCGSKKTCEVVYARIQGKEALVQHFWNSTFPCSRSDYLPVSFTPPRNGSGGAAASQECIIGRMARNSLIKCPVN